MNTTVGSSGAPTVVNAGRGRPHVVARLADLLRRSLARRLLTVVILTTAIVTGAASLAAYVVYSRVLEREQVSRIEGYVSQRRLVQEEIFRQIAAHQTAANEALSLRLSRMKGVDLSRKFDRLFPLLPDGTRRSTPSTYAGRMTVDGMYTYELAGFFYHGDELTSSEKNLYYIIYDVASRFGESSYTGSSNFLFQNERTYIGFSRYPPTTLMTERVTRGRTQRIRSVANELLAGGQRGFRCAPMRPMTYSPKVLGTMCVTPVVVDGRLVGGWGQTLAVNGYLRQAVSEHLAGVFNVIADADGRLVAHPTLRLGMNGAQVASLQASVGTPAVVRAIKARKSAVGVLLEAHRDYYVAYGHIAGPDWYFLVYSPKRDVFMAAERAAALILLCGGLAMLLQVILLFGYVRHDVVNPLGRLTRSEGGDGTASSDQEAELANVGLRADEIGLLARTLRSKDHRFRNLLQSLEDRVAERTLALKHATEAKSMFLANMSHELRTPLNGVVAMADMLTRSGLNSRQQEMADLLASSSQLLGALINDILDFEKLEAGQMALTPAPFDMRVLVNSVAELHRPAAAKKGVALDWKLAVAVDRTFLGDPLRLQQILSNLLSNAIKFTQDGRVTLTVGLRGGAVLFRVTDTGIGFDKEAARRLFQRFEQADSTITKRFGGTGLGLSICRTLSELMGGQITARSAPGKGSTFEVRLPLPVAEQQTPAAAPTTSPVDCRALSRVLVVEDNPQNQRIACIVLQSLGYEVGLAANGLEGVETRQAEAYELIFMDMQMPVMDGLEATRRIRAWEAETGKPRIPIVMLSANAMEEHLAASRQAGASAHVSKPYTADSLLRGVALATAEEDSRVSEDNVAIDAA